MSTRLPFPSRSRFTRRANRSGWANAAFQGKVVNAPAGNRSLRAIALMSIATLFMSVCIARLVQLQLIEGEYHRKRAENNRVRLVPITAERGNIIDRKGKLIATNRLSRSVYLWPKEESPAQWQVTAVELSRILNIKSDEILEKLGQADYTSAMPVRISQNLTPEAFIALEERSAQFPGLEIRIESNRYYPHENLAAHLLGYIGEATATEMKAHPEFPVGMIVGKAGIERIADPKLRGIWGSRLIEVDARRRELRELGISSPTAGSDLQLTLDLDLQKTAEKALANRRGAVVVMDIKTGAVLVLASGPTFDPNIFTDKVTKAEWQSLQQTENPLLNRALQGYPPGSTFKIVTAAAAMQSGKFSPNSKVATSGYITVGGVRFREHGGSGYGVIGFPDAFAYSSNTFFYQVGMATGPEEISKWGHRLGIGEGNNLGLTGGKGGSIPTPDRKKQLYGQPWYVGDSVTMAIGQGLVLVTPLEMAMMVSAIANGGFRVKPHLFTSHTNTPETKPVPIGLARGTIDTIRAGLIAVVKKGTAKRLNDGSIPLTAGKTGTAEVPGGADNALFVGYGPVDNPQIAVAVVVENGGFGAVSAVPIAHEIYKVYFKKGARD